MRSLLLLLFVFLLKSFTQAQLLITNTTVADVENKKLLRAQNVLIQNGLITAIGTKVKAPAGIQTIDGTGKYLVPGFVDGHVHFFQSGGIYTRPDVIDLTKYRPYDQEINWVHANMENFLRRYTYAGITSVVDVGSTVNFLRQRDTFRTKEYAPDVYMTGPLLTTLEPPLYKGLKDDEPFYEMNTTDDARRYVQQNLQSGSDFIKIAYLVQGTNLDSAARKHLPVVKAAIDEAHKNGLRVMVHARERITSQLAAEAGADYLVHIPDNEPIDTEYVQLLKKKKIVVASSLIVVSGYATTFNKQYKLTENDFHYAHPTPLNSLIDFKYLPDTALRNRYSSRMESNKARTKTSDSIRQVNLKRLVDEGVTVCTATDAGNIGTPHVSSYFSELAAMENSGMSMWQLLQSSTINGGRAVGKESEFGSIQKGKKANLVLLNKNPLDSISNWKSIEWVINKGVAQKPDSIRKLSALEIVEKQALAYNGHNLEFYITTIADDIEMYRLPGQKLDLKGRDSVYNAFKFLNSSPDLYARILNRIVEENMIVDHEEVYFQDAKKPHYGIAIYHVKNGKINRVFFY